jgi:hypothetical protein
VVAEAAAYTMYKRHRRGGGGDDDNAASSSAFDDYTVAERHNDCGGLDFNLVLVQF